MVLGMHRSGTSWLAGELQERGLALGDVNMSARYNQRGNRENGRVGNLHDTVLSDSGGCWNRPPRRVEWSDKRRLALDTLIHDMDTQFGGTWGFKDPRTLLVFDEWQRRLGPRLRPIGIFRHPSSVATSLLARELQPRDRIRGRRHALQLWNAYCENLTALHRETPFPLIRFDTDPRELEAQLTKALDLLGVPLIDAATTNFAPQLVHDASTGRVPRRCRTVWSYLTVHQIR